MKGTLLNERQPFGEVHDSIEMPGQGRPPIHVNRPLGADTVNGNDGMDHGPSFSDPNPGADREAKASAPFHYCGINSYGGR